MFELIKTEEELKQVAVDLFANKIFCNRHIHEGDVEHMLPVIFMPIALGVFKDAKEEDLQKIGLIYEYYEQAMPRSINGYPTFHSARILNKEDTEKVLNYYDQIKEAINKIL